MEFRKHLLAIALPAVLLAGCGGDSSVEVKPLTVTIVHINDHHSNLDEFSGGITLKLDGADTTAKLGGFARVKSAIDKIAAGKENVLKLHAGDAQVGTLYYTYFKGAADAALMNTVCFDAMAVGNHEFDDGDAQLKSFIDNLHAGACKTPVVSANVTPKVGTPLAPAKTDDYIKPYAIKDFNGEKVGIIGLTIADKTKGSSRPLSTTDIGDEATAAQKAIDALKSQGIKRIVLLSHLGYSQDKSIAAKLTDVDVIIGGDSHTLLGNYSAYGLTAQGEYPTKVKNKDGDTVCIAQAWEYSKAVGELKVEFSSEQKVASCSGVSHLLIDGDFTRKDAAGKTYTVAGAELDTLNATIAKDPQLLKVAPDANAAAVLKTYADQVEGLKAQVIGAASETLCIERVPGSGYSKDSPAGCNAATRAHGSDIGNLVAWAFREFSLKSEIGIQNGGGVRVSIPAGTITMGLAHRVMPFSNTLVELDMTGAEIKQVLEEAVDNAVKTGGTTGSYPYAAGVRWTVDLTKSAGSRLSNLEFKGKTDTAWSALNLTRTYKVVTNSYIADGKDGYLTFKTVKDSGRFLDTYLLYTDAFIEYVRKQGSIKKLPVSEYSTQQFIDASGTLLQ